jgi:hypothetical protein
MTRVVGEYAESLARAASDKISRVYARGVAIARRLMFLYVDYGDVSVYTIKFTLQSVQCHVALGRLSALERRLSDTHFLRYV